MIILLFAENAIQLVPDGTLLIHLAAVVIMVAVLNRTLFRPINKILADREAETSGRASEAKRVQLIIEQSLIRYERVLRDARTSAYHLVESERAEAMKLREQRINMVKGEIRTWVAREKAELERQAAAARESLKAAAVQSAIEIGTQILHRSISSGSIPREY
jgi:F-type H+-transporting ATPase subunit b